MDRDVALLAELPPAHWNNALMRAGSVEAYERLDRPTGQDAERHARLLRLSTRSFYRLLRARRQLEEGARARRSLRGAKRFLSPEIEDIIASVQRELGPEAPERAVHLEVMKRCAQADLDQPSYNSVRTRASGSTVDLRIRLGRRCDLIVDVCPLDVDLITAPECGVAMAHLSAIFKAQDGLLLGHVLTPGPPDRNDLREMLRPQMLAVGPATLVATKGVTDAVQTLDAELIAARIHFDSAASRGLRTGAAMIPALGRRLGKVTLLPRRHASADLSAAIPIDVARKVISHLVTSIAD